MGASELQGNSEKDSDVIKPHTGMLSVAIGFELTFLEVFVQLAGSVLSSPKLRSHSVLHHISGLVSREHVKILPRTHHMIN